jgi:site-specific recombinase XerD
MLDHAQEAFPHNRKPGTGKTGQPAGSILPERNLTKMRLADLLDNPKGYVEYLTQTVARATRYNYTAWARKFLRHLPPDATPDAISFAEVYQYLDSMKETHRPRTIRTCLYALRSFCAWLKEEGWISANHALRVKPPKLDTPVKEWPTDEAVAAMLKACERVANPDRRALARAVVNVLTYTGLRRCELLALCVGDVDQARGCLMIRRGKGDKARTVYPHPNCIAAIAAYLKVRRSCDESRLFLLRTDVAMGTVGLRSLLRDLHAIAGLDGSRALLPHGYRRGTASRLARNGALITDIQQFLGHSSLTTTAMYLDTGIERMQQIAHLTAIPSLIDGGEAPQPAATAPQKTKPGNQAKPRPKRRFHRVSLRN